MYAKFTRLKDIYAEIHRQCVLKFLHNPNAEAAKIFPQIISECEKMLAVYEKKILKEQLGGIDKDVCEAADENLGIAAEIKKAYHSVWMADTLDEEDSFFLSVKQAKLLNWEDGKSPYRELHNVCARYKEEVQGRGDDIVFVFEKICAALEQNLPFDVFVREVDNIFGLCHKFMSEERKPDIL